MQVDELVIKYLQGDITEEEQLFLDQWIALSDTNQKLFEQLISSAYISGELEKFYSYDEDKAWSRISKQAIVKKLSFNWRRLVAAAALLIFICGGAYLFFNQRHKPSTTGPAIADINAPKSNKATITLTDGKTITLDSIKSGMLAQQDNMKLLKRADGQVVYEKTNGETVQPIQYNTLTNPRGSTVIDMILSDGSHVWLNAGSSITYPVAFKDGERNVSITGEAYFEVAHNAMQPFVVHKGETSVTVLGTHFNVNAYDDEPAIKVTLLEGSVKVKYEVRNTKYEGKDPNNEVIIKPGQQAVAIDNKKLKIENNIDLEEVMAWKNGRFELNGNTIGPIMRQVARWYDVDIEYNGPVPTDNFMGGTSRQANVSELLNILEQTKTVKFRVEGRKIIVSK